MSHGRLWCSDWAGGTIHEPGDQGGMAGGMAVLGGDRCLGRPLAIQVRHRTCQQVLREELQPGESIWSHQHVDGVGGPGTGETPKRGCRGPSCGSQRSEVRERGAARKVGVGGIRSTCDVEVEKRVARGGGGRVSAVTRRLSSCEPGSRAVGFSEVCAAGGLC